MTQSATHPEFLILQVLMSPLPETLLSGSKRFQAHAGLCCATMRTMAAAKVGCFACCDESCVAPQKLDRSSQRFCIDPSVMHVSSSDDAKASAKTLPAADVGLDERKGLGPLLRKATDGPAG
jgi:hypothetical protein